VRHRYRRAALEPTAFVPDAGPITRHSPTAALVIPAPPGSPQVGVAYAGRPPYANLAGARLEPGSCSTENRWR
jgi:hypothetical protein